MKKRYLVFARLVRDAQVYVGHVGDDDFNDNDKDWRDFNGLILLLDRYEDSIDDVWNILKQNHPNASKENFFIMEVADTREYFSTLEKADAILDVMDEVLCERGMTIVDDEDMDEYHRSQKEEGNTSCIYGNAYFALEDALIHALDSGIEVPETDRQKVEKAYTIIAQIVTSRNKQGCLEDALGYLGEVLGE